MLNIMRKDVDVGMLFSNLVMFFIVLTCGSVLYPHGIRKIDPVQQAGTALKPIPGNLAYPLFPSASSAQDSWLSILSGSLSYMVAESFNRKSGLDQKFTRRNLLRLDHRFARCWFAVEFYWHHADPGADIFGHTLRTDRTCDNPCGVAYQ